MAEPKSPDLSVVRGAIERVKAWVDAENARKPFGMYLDPDDVSTLLSLLSDYMGGSERSAPAADLASLEAQLLMAREALEPFARWRLVDRTADHAELLGVSSSQHGEVSLKGADFRRAAEAHARLLSGKGEVDG